MLTVVTPASSFDLASLETVKAGLGITGSAEDTTLPPLITAASAAIASCLNRVLVQETVEETFRSPGYGGTMLSRYPVREIDTVTEDGTTLQEDGFEVDLGAGIVNRVRDGSVRCWARGSTVIEYVAGYSLADMPPDIVQALVMLVAHYRSSAARDPLLRAEETTDVERLEYFIPTDGGLPGPVQALLAPHRKPAGC